MNLPAFPLPRRAAAGFTLIELMITVAIAAILAAIAYPSYTEHVRKSRRTDAKTALLDLAARQERLFSTQNVYGGTPAALGYAGDAFPVAVQSGGQAYYQLTVVAGNPATSYTATAAPVGPQAGDDCGSYTLNHLGLQGNTGMRAGVASAQCW
ncbi:putative TYPE 4 fimbrial BIOGENESIS TRANSMEMBRANE pilE-related PROTEIN [Cupriavidus phytorum]|uniref:TYPE 4 fimbrial BIOGENESIS TRANSMEMBRANE pilE-related PROTEIN n=2 Tax=Cupriavidus TaxID=106589 RepID=A0A375C879_9BURK|nr:MULTISPECIES: type IV pilin protein [Cupriavidus]PZX29507.1 type IV pilus assembly protein PilE [Cupriavidus alkaliphilus]SOY64459.1 putative TYPE 4 fimbrial BIOGENESIS TRANSMEMBRANE pilE-related PROTEIN [Cupriavidus taiwanensis]